MSKGRGCSTAAQQGSWNTVVGGDRVVGMRAKPLGNFVIFYLSSNLVQNTYYNRKNHNIP